MKTDREEDGHAFETASKCCRNCGMTLEYYENHGTPRCTGRGEGPDDEPHLPTDDPLPNAL